jgi:hypothetical protein
MRKREDTKGEKWTPIILHGKSGHPLFCKRKEGEKGRNMKKRGEKWTPRCAGINRHEAENERVLQERNSDPS